MYKKIFLSGSVIVFFLLYSVYIHTRRVGDDVPIILGKKGSTFTNTTTTSLIPTQNTTGTITQTPSPTSLFAYHDGTYVGSIEDAIYGNLQVQAIITKGKLSNVTFLQFPSDRNTSIFINQQADPQLVEEAIQAQNAQVDIVSGATDSSEAFIASLQTALSKATKS